MAKSKCLRTFLAAITVMSLGKIGYDKATDDTHPVVVAATSANAPSIKPTAPTDRPTITVSPAPRPTVTVYPSSPSSKPSPSNPPTASQIPSLDKVYAETAPLEHNDKLTTNKARKAADNFLNQNFDPDAFDKHVDKYQTEIEFVAGEFGVPANMIATIMTIESDGDPNTKSSVGAIGLMQIMLRYHQDEIDQLAAKYHLDKDDPLLNVLVGA
ncbi:MAG: transglycosylase SLT domain-containing protein, partial [Candidatus Nomurabacteria bacterium]|nr:transglycosylase SLT domain-containing protein [Candidatus Nomurabacteria bacterium]